MAEEQTQTATAQGDAAAPEKVYVIGEGWVDKPKDAEVTNQGSLIAKPAETTPPAATEKKEDPAKPDTTTPPPVVPTFDKEKYSKYGIEKEEDLVTTLDKLDAINKEAEELRKKAAGPAFKSERHEKLFKYLEQYPEESWNEVLKTGGEIMGIDPDSADGVRVLQEAFIIQHPMVSRDEAKLLFNRQHNQKYSLKAKEEYEDPQQYEDDKKYNDIQMKIEVDKARQIVREKKAQLAVATNKEEPARREAPAESMNSYLGEIDRVLDGTTKGSGLAYMDKNFIRVKSDEKGEPVLSIELPAEKLKELRETAATHLKNPGLYDNSGKISTFNAAKDTLTLAFALWPEWISQQMAKQVDTLAATKKAEQIAAVTPDKVETTQGKDITTMSIDEQARELARKEKENRERQQRR